MQSVKTKGMILRSKAQIVEEGERNTKFFLNLEKNNYNKKHMKAVINHEGILVTKPQEVLMEQANFYRKLYTSRQESASPFKKLDDKFIENKNIPRLTIEQKSVLDHPLTIEDLALALKNMKNYKTPGLDGFTTNFYKFFGADLKALFFEIICHSFQVGELSCGLRRGILSLLPKTDKDLRYLKSWRPVSLNAMKLQMIISDIVSNDQVGYIKGRFIGENVQIIEDLDNRKRYKWISSFD